MKNKAPCLDIVNNLQYKIGTVIVGKYLGTSSVWILVAVTIKCDCEERKVFSLETNWWRSGCVELTFLELSKDRILLSSASPAFLKYAIDHWHTEFYEDNV